MTAGRTRLEAAPERVNPVNPAHIWRSPAGSAADIIVVADLAVYGDIYELSRASLPNETGGFLLGRVSWDARSRVWLVHVDEAVPVEPISQTPVHFSFSWRDVDRVRARREAQGKALVGWYHTHPDMGVFLSETDVEKTHRVLFSEPFQIALVFDPVRGTAGYFFWESPQVLDPHNAPWREFHIALDEEPPPPTASEPVEILATLAPGAVPDGDATGRDSPLAARFRDAAEHASASIDRAPAERPVSPSTANRRDLEAGGTAAAGTAAMQSRLLPDELPLHPELEPSSAPKPAAGTGRNSRITTVAVSFVLGLVAAAAAILAYLRWAR